MEEPMRDFRECGPLEGAQRLFTLISHLTILRDDSPRSPLTILTELSFAVAFGDSAGVYRLYHDLTRALLLHPARRVSGDLFMDYLLYLAVEREHPFAKMAAAGSLEEAERLAMKSDLAALGELATLDWTNLCRMAAERARDIQLKPRYAKDEISVMSAAAWTGSTPRHSPATPPSDGKPAGATVPPFPLPEDSDWLPWHYGESELRGEYASDEALEEVYFRLMKSPDWRILCDDLWNLFASYGSGPFLQSRVFRYENGKLLSGKASQAYAPEHMQSYVPVSFHERQRVALTDHVIRFMRGGKAAPVLLYGPEGSGKTALVESLVEDLPELRLVRVDGYAGESLAPLLALLSGQPLRFLLLLDDVPLNTPRSRPLLCSCTGGGLPDNVLPVATAREQGELSRFPFPLRLVWPKLADFIGIVTELLEADGFAEEAARGWVRNAAVDYQVDAHESLTMAAACLIAQRYRAERDRLP